MEIKFARSDRGIFISQIKYILDLLEQTGLMGCRQPNTPIEPNLKLDVAKTDAHVNKERYLHLAGKLIYLAHTRPDISFAISLMSQFMYSPGREHHEAVVRILKCLKGTPGKGCYLLSKDYFICLH